MLGPFGIEIAFSQFVQSFSNPELSFFFRAVTVLGEPLIWLVLVSFFYWKGETKKALFLAAAILVSYSFVGPLKEVFGRFRPGASEIVRIANAGGFSLPSGHATTVASVLGYMWGNSK